MQWTCSAHDGGLLGAEGAGDGCFLAAAMGRCRNRRQCQSRIRKERGKLTSRLHELVEEGNPIFAEVASELPLPQTMLLPAPDEPATTG
jgi:hypothetical protein